MAKKTNKKVLYDIKTGTRMELPEDDKRSDMVAELMTGTGIAVEENQAVLDQAFVDSLGTPDNLAKCDPKRNAEQVMAMDYPELVRSPDPIGLLKAILTELIMQRMWRK